jgi:DNA-binding NarL/FixJ family response regulator
MHAKEKINVLLIDTDRNVCSGYRSVLEKERDMDVVAEATDLESANQASEMFKPDVIVLDENLVDFNGNQQLSHWIFGMQDVKVLVASFHSDSRFVIRMLHAGASGYMLKNCAYEELASAVRTVMANRTYISPGIAGIIREIN